MYTFIYVCILGHSGISSSHKHPYWELFFNLNPNLSNCIVMIDGDPHVFDYGDVLCIPPETIHYELSQAPLQIGYIIFDAACSLDKKVYHFKSKHNDFDYIFRTIYSVYATKPENFKKITDSFINLIEQFMVSWSVQNTKSDVVRKLENILIENSAKSNLKVESIMKEMHFSVSHLRKLFKSEIGKSPIEYLTNTRIENSKYLLSQTQLSIKNIAIMAGFNDPYYFSRLFKKITGISPTKWRENLINSNN